MSKFSQHLLSVFIAALYCLQFHHHVLHAEAQSTTVRPYKFGFTIDEQQHRYEKRDERGIVMGEFGFITADGIYHVTVYATDEEGRFRILAMKNYPYDGKPKTIEIMMKPKAAPVTTTTTTTTAKPTLPRQNFYNEACSGCFLSNGNNKPKSPGETAVKTGIRTLSKPLPNVGVAQPKSATQPKSGAGSATAATQPKAAAGKPGSGPQATKHLPIATTLHQTIKPSVQHKPTLTYGNTQTPTNYIASQTKTSTLITAASNPKRGFTNSGLQHHTVPQHTVTHPRTIVASPQYTQTPSLTTGNTGFAHTQTRQFSSNSQNTPNLATEQRKTPTIQPNVMDVIVNQVLPSVMGSKGVVAKPTTSTAPPGRSPMNSLIPTGKSGSTNTKYGKANSNPVAGGGRAGPSAAGGDGDLYRFKYVLDYHGHTETGKHNGNKEGNYFAIGDDDIERTIEYVADENGYQPRIHWRKLNSPVPSKENTLKDYEFVWFTLK